MTSIFNRSHATSIPTIDDAQFTAGTRTLADLVAPGMVAVTPRHLEIDGQFLQTLYITGLPRSVRVGWLSPLLDHDDAIELSIHLTPLETGHIIRHLERQQLALVSTQALAERHGQLSGMAQRSTAASDVANTINALQQGTEKIFSVGMYLTVRATSPEVLDAAMARIMGAIDGMLSHARVAVLQQDIGFRSVLPQGEDHLQVRRNLTTTGAATLFPFTSGTVSMERGLLYGITPTSQSMVLIDPFDDSLDNANMAILAASGAGKSYFLKLLVMRALLHDQHVWLIDRDLQEYRPLCDAYGGQRVVLSPGSPDRLNPFDLPRGSRSGSDDPLAEAVAALTSWIAVMVCRPGEALSPEELAVLDQALYETYDTHGITADPTTHARPVPTLATLADLLVGGDDVARSLARRLTPYVTGSFARLFSSQTTVRLDNRLTVFDVSALEESVRPLATHLINVCLWSQARADPRPRLLIVDEAWHMLQYPAGAAFLERVARGARKHWLGLITATQDVQDVLGSQAGHAILTNSATKLLLKQDTTTIAPVVAAFSLSRQERHDLLSAGTGNGLLYCRGSHIPLRIIASAQEHSIATSRPAERQALDTVPSRVVVRTVPTSAGSLYGQERVALEDAV